MKEPKVSLKKIKLNVFQWCSHRYPTNRSVSDDSAIPFTDMQLDYFGHDILTDNVNATTE